MQSQQFSHSLFRVPSSQSSYFKSQQQGIHHTKHQQRSSTYFKQLQESQQAKKLKATEVSSELESKSGERLTALHSKLQQEAEKIRKWKNATEVEIKHKDKYLEEAHQKIESQSKSLTDLQMKNESLSSRLREEVANQRDIQQKIATTRDMCTALKNHAVRVDEALCKGQYDKEQLIETDRVRMIQFQKLLEKFQELEGNQLEWEKLQNDALNAEKNKNASLTNTCERLREQLDDAHSKISSLEGQCADHKKCIEHLKEQIQEKTLQCDQLSKEKANLEHALCVRDSEANQLEGRLDDIQRQLAETQSQLAEKEQLLAIAKDAIKQNETTFNEQLATMESALSAERCLKEELIRTKDELATKLQTVEESLTAERDKLRAELGEAKVQLEASYQSCTDLEQSLASEKSEKEAVLKEKDTLSCQLVDLGEVLETVTKEIKEKDENIASIQASLGQSKSEFEAAQLEWKENQTELHQQIASLEGDKARLEAQTSQLSSELCEAQSNLEQQESSSKQGADKYKECIESLKSSMQERETEIADLKAKLETLTKTEAELISRCSELDQLKEENKRLQESLTTQLSHSKGLQNELSDLRNQMKMQIGELSELVEKYKKEALNAAQERDDAKKAYDAHVNELCSTMQRYSTENEKMVQQREKSIAALKQQLEDTEKVKEVSESKLDECQRQLEQARSEIAVKSEEIKELLKAVECMQSKPSCIVPATPQRSTTTPRNSSTPLHSVTPLNPVLESPKYPAYNSYTTPNKLGQHPKITTTTSNIPSTPAAPTNNDNNGITTARVPSTPSRMYNYRVCSLPRTSSKSRPPPSTPRSNRPKKMKYQSEENEEKVPPDTVIEDDETIFKKPKIPRVTSNVTVRKASTTSSGACTTTVSSSTKQPSSARKPLKNRNSRVYGKQKAVGKMTSEENLSWFDTDSVFSFGPND